jgi:hypothetical protein
MASQRPAGRLTLSAAPHAYGTRMLSSTKRYPVRTLSDVERGADHEVERHRYAGSRKSVTLRLERRSRNLPTARSRLPQVTAGAFEEAPMAIVAGLDLHRAQITFDALDRETVEVRRAACRPRASRCVAPGSTSAASLRPPLPSRQADQAGSPQLRWALYESAQAACRPTSPDRADYLPPPTAVTRSTSGRSRPPRNDPARRRPEGRAPI